jgi:hypothetical protein
MLEVVASLYPWIPTLTILAFVAGIVISILNDRWG